MSTFAPVSLSDALRQAVRGAVAVPGDAGYDAARSPFHLTVDQRPAAVVAAIDARDVAATLHVARTHGLAVAAQATGHGATGLREDVVLVRTNEMRAIEIDEASRVARVEPGVRWGELHALSAPLGLHGVCGTAPGVSIVGYCLGGGISWFARKYGYGANSIVAVDLVTAAGEQLRVTDECDPELMRALRGGSGNYGIVTAMEIQLHEAEEMFGGQVMWMGEHSAAVLSAYRDWVATVPEELTSVITLFRVPPIPDAPEFLHDQWVVWVGFAYLGDAKAGCELVSPLLDAVDEPMLSELGPLGIDELGRIAKEPVDPIPSHHRTELLRELDDRTLEDVQRVAGPASDSPLLFVMIRHLGGALGRPSAVPSAADHVDAAFMVYGLGAPFGGPEHDAAIRAVLRGFADTLSDRATGGSPLTFIAPGEGLDRVFGEDDLARLRAVKDRVDPDGVIRANYAL
jgi:FAD/FMN-containing dehydrogenase